MRVETVRVAAPTSTGTTDFTVSGGGTCIGAIFWMSAAVADDTPVNGAFWGYGACDGTNQFANSTSSQHAQLATNTAKRAMTDQCICLIIATGALDGESAFDSFITDGVRINTGNAYAAGYFINARLFFNDDGANDDFHVGTFDTSAGNDDVTEPGFEPTFVEVASIRGAFNDTAQNGGGFSLGWAYNHPSLPTPPQVSMNWGEGDNAADGAPRMRVESALVCADHSGAGLLGQVEINTFDSSGFTAEQVNGAGYVCGYVAVKCANEIDVDLFSTPTSTGAQSYTGPGFAPQAVMGFLTRVGASESTDVTGLAGSWGAFIFTSTTVEFSNSVQMEDASPSTDTQSIADSIAVNLPEHDGTSDDGIEGSVTSILSNGFEITYTVVSSAACLFGALAIKPTTKTLSPSAIASAEAWGTATLQQVATILPSAIASAEAWGTPSLSATVNVSPSSVASAEAWGTPSLATTVNVSPSGITSGEAWGTALLQSLATVSPSAITSAEAWGTPTLTLGALAISPTAIASAEAWGTPTLSPGVASILVNAIASAEAWGAPTLTLGGLTIVPTGIASEEAWGTPALSPGAVSILVVGIASAEAWGNATLAETGTQQITVTGIASSEAWGSPYLFGGAVPMTLKKKIHDALCAAAEGGTFLVATYDSENCTLEQGLQIVPASVEANELSSAHAVESRHGRKYLQDFTDWQWLVILRFHQEAICELWVRSLMEDPPCIHRDAFEDRQVRLLLLDAQYEHPPREGASNGTKAQFRFRAELSAR